MTFALLWIKPSLTFVSSLWCPFLPFFWSSLSQWPPVHVWAAVLAHWPCRSETLKTSPFSLSLLSPVSSVSFSPPSCIASIMCQRLTYSKLIHFKDLVLYIPFQLCCFFLCCQWLNFLCALWEVLVLSSSCVGLPWRYNRVASAYKHMLTYFSIKSTLEQLSTSAMYPLRQSALAFSTLQLLTLHI